MQAQLETKDEKTLRYEYIAHQINREDNLVNFRLTWALTLNGFLFAALGFLAGKEVPNKSLLAFFHWALPLTGTTVSLVGLLGVIAAQLQINHLAKQWRELVDGRWPRPFGGKWSFLMGTLPSFVPPLVLSCVWVGLYYYWS